MKKILITAFICAVFIVCVVITTRAAQAQAITLDPTNVVVPVTINGTAYDVRVKYKDLGYAIGQTQANASANHVVFPGTNYQAQDGHVYSVGADGSVWRDGRTWLTTKVQELLIVGPEIYAYGASTGLLYRYSTTGWIAVTSYPNGLLDKIPVPAPAP